MDNKIMNASMIAAELNTTPAYVYVSLHERMKTAREGSLAYKIRKMALEHGGTLNADHSISLSYLSRANFTSDEQRDERMRVLRANGYTNEEIADKVGCALNTVNRAIGLQPECYTEISADYGAKIRMLQIEAREKRVEAYKLALIEEQKAKIAEMERKLNDNIIQFEQMKTKIDEQRKALEVAKAELGA